MKNSWLRRAVMSAGVVLLFGWLGAVNAADLNPAAIKIVPPKDIKWVENANGGANAVLAGDPNKPGLYVVLTKWHPHHTSRPHFHPNDRFIYVLSGTWWVSTSNKYDLMSDWGPTSNDVRHRFVANAVYELPFGIQAGGIVTANSAPPYNIISGVDTNRDGDNNDRPAGVAFNAGRGDAQAVDQIVPCAKPDGAHVGVTVTETHEQQGGD